MSVVSYQLSVISHQSNSRKVEKLKVKKLKVKTKARGGSVLNFNFRVHSY